MRLRRSLLVALTGLLVAAPAAAADCPWADLVPTGENTVAVRVAVLCLTNAERAAAGLPALAAEGHLEAAGQAYAQRMVTERFFSHVGPDGSQMAGRLVAYRGWSALGENLAWGELERGTPRGAVAAWMASAGHRANILSRSYTELGVGVAPGSPGGSDRPSATYAAEYGARRVVRTPAVRRPAHRQGTTAHGRAAALAAKRNVGRSRVRSCGLGKVRRVTRFHGRRAVRCGRVVSRAQLIRLPRA